MCKNQILNGSAVFTIILSIALTYFIIHFFLAKKHASFVSTMWLGFSITLVGLFAVLWVARYKGAIDNSGAILKPPGIYVSYLIHFLLDLEGERDLIVLLIAVVLTIPAVTFLLAAPSQCAQKYSLFQPTIQAGIIFFLKGMISAAGAFTAIVLVRPLLGIDFFKSDASAYSLAAMIAAASVPISFALAHIYLEIPTFISNTARFIKRRHFKLYSMIDKGINWATKNNCGTANAYQLRDTVLILRILKRMQHRHAYESKEFRDDMMHLISLIRQAERYDAKAAKNSAPSNTAIYTAQQQEDPEEQCVRLKDIDRLLGKHNL